MTAHQAEDTSTRFLFEDADIRGELVTLTDSLNKVMGEHPYSPGIRRLMGQFSAAAVLISNNLKYRGKIILQARSNGPLSLVMVECTSAAEIRGIARGDIAADSEQPLDLMPDAQLAITIERSGGQRYQGIVALDGGSLASALDNYFHQSEQLNTRFWLHATHERASGMVLQQLPAQRQQDAKDRENQWQNAVILADTITPDELIELPSMVIVHRLFNEEPLRVFEPKPVVFRCSCSRARSLNALATLDPATLEEILLEDGEIGMTCEMCGVHYAFTREELPGLAEPKVLH